MLLPLYLMEDELEEGEIIDRPLLPTPTTNLDRKHLKQDSKYNNIKPFSFSNSSSKGRVNKHKYGLCKSRKKNASECVRVVKYKVKPSDTTENKLKTTKNKQDPPKITRNAKNVITNYNQKYRTFPKRYNDPFLINSDYEINKDSSYEDLLNQYKCIQSQLKTLREGTKYDKNVLNSSNVKSSKTETTKKRKILPSPEKPKLVENKKCEKSPVKATAVDVQAEIIIVSEDEDNDLELLRQAALASRAKLPLNSLLVEDTISISDDNSQQHFDILQPMADNYEVIDMEVSDEDTDDIEILSEQDLNILKNTITEENINGDLEVQFSYSDNSNNDDEILMLRTKLLAEMNEKHKLNCVNNVDLPNEASVEHIDYESIVNNVPNECEEMLNPISSEDNFCVIELPSSSEIKPDSDENVSLIVRTENIINDLCQENVINSNENILENISIVKSDENRVDDELTKSEGTVPIELSIINKENIIKNNNVSISESVFNSENISMKMPVKRKKPLLFIPSEPVKPLVIQLGNSSESESENEDDSGGSIFASLEQLITTAKNNIENLTDEDKKDATPVQTETNEQLPSKEIVQNKKPDTKQNQLRIIFNDLFSKLLMACRTYKEDQQLFSVYKLQANRKKSAFVASQLEVNRLKEQLLAAQKMKSDSQKLMYIANTKLAAVQKAVIKKRTLIEDLRKECTKRGLQIFGPNYVLPKFEMNSSLKFGQKTLATKNFPS